MMDITLFEKTPVPPFTSEFVIVRNHTVTPESARELRKARVLHLHECKILPSAWKALLQEGESSLRVLQIRLSIEEIQKLTKQRLPSRPNPLLVLRFDSDTPISLELAKTIFRVWCGFRVQLMSYSFPPDQISSLQKKEEAAVQ